MKTHQKPNHYRYIILGGGLTAGYAARTFVENGLQPGELAIISAEPNPPYERPPLSKGFLAGEKGLEDIWINDPHFYVQHGIDIFLNQPVERVDFDGRQLHTAEQLLGFDKLLIATGAAPRTLDLTHSDAGGIFYLRRVGDAQRIRGAAGAAKRALVIGGGFIGMEAAAIMCQEGLETSLVFPEGRVWAAFFTPALSTFFQDFYEKKGVTIVPGRKATDFHIDDDGQVAGVELNSGEILPADLVIAGVGVKPNTDLFIETDLELDDGILVNRYLETSLPDVYAAGDVARYEDVLLGQTRRVEHWDNAVQQAEHAALGMLGRRKIFNHVPYYFSDIFDLSYEFWGDPESAEKVVYRGNPEEGSISAWWLADGRLVAAFVMDRPDEERDKAQEWIAAQTLVPEAFLKEARSSFDALTEMKDELSKEAG